MPEPSRESERSSVCVLRISNWPLSTIRLSFKMRKKCVINRTKLTLSLIIEVPVPSREKERSCILCLRVIKFASFYDFSVVFWNKNVDIKFGAHDAFLG